ncbi:MAG: hypothetical protein HXS54_04260 [Theionarchaea archaeon]|nr:hypothetical protein [Theionarchaea archaeon]
MADVLFICIREEDKNDFVVEFIKGLMSRGLTVSYAGALFCERKDQYVYDDVTNLLFFASTYFRETRMKSKNFITWEGFLDSIDFDHAEAKLVIYAILCRQKISFEVLEKKFCSFLEENWKHMAAEMIRSSLEMDFSTFESCYSDIIEILGFNRELLERTKNRVIDRQIGRGIVWPNDIFDRFIFNNIQMISIPENSERREEILHELEQNQKEVELECLRDPKKAEKLIVDFFGSEIIDIASKNPERIMFFDISRRSPKKKILCLYYEEKHNEAIKLCLYPEYGGEAIRFHSYLEESTGEKTRESTGEETRESTGEETRESTGEETRESTGEIKRFCLGNFRERRDLYKPKTIGTIIDKHVMLALHPSLVDIYFPVNDFMIEVDPEEPEIGFLSRKIDLENNQTREEVLRIDTRLREKIHVYRYNEDMRGESGWFARMGIGDKKENSEEKLLILGRLENLYEVLLANKRYGRFYQPIHFILKFLVFLVAVYFVSNTLQMYFSDVNKNMTILTLISMFVFPIFVLVGFFFAFWALRIFVLDYLLDPLYRLLKWSTYVILIFMLSIGTESMILNTLLLFFVFFCGILIFNNYIRSAALYELNDLFGIIDHNDSLNIEGYENRPAEVLKCSRFETIIKKGNTEEVYSNSCFFPIICWVSKRYRTVPRRIAYSSGVFLTRRSEEESVMDSERKLVEELIYRKPRTWGFWGAVRNLLFGRGMIESQLSSDSEHSSSDRFIYFGQWKDVLRHISSAIPIFPQYVLFRNMLILAALSGLFFNIFVTYDVSLELLRDWIEKISFWTVIKYLIFPALWVLVTRIFRFQFWKVFLIIIFIYLLSIQPLYIKILAFLVFSTVIGLFWFPIQQVYYSLKIWWFEICNGAIISVKKKDGNREKGTRIQRDILVTRLFMSWDCIEEERIYFNKRFFSDIVENDEWDKNS